jgi:hypothetical protein
LLVLVNEKAVVLSLRVIVCLVVKLGDLGAFLEVAIRIEEREGKSGCG